MRPLKRRIRRLIDRWRTKPAWTHLMLTQTPQQITLYLNGERWAGLPQDGGSRTIEVWVGSTLTPANAPAALIDSFSIREAR